MVPTQSVAADPGAQMACWHGPHPAIPRNTADGDGFHQRLRNLQRKINDTLRKLAQGETLWGRMKIYWGEHLSISTYEGLAPHDRARGERGVGMPETCVTAALSLLQTPLGRPTADGDLPKVTQRTGRGQRLSRGALWPAARAPSHSPVGLLRKGGRAEVPRPLWLPIWWCQTLPGALSFLLPHRGSPSLHPAFLSTHTSPKEKTAPVECFIRMVIWCKC